MFVPYRGPPAQVRCRLPSGECCCMRVRKRLLGRIGTIRLNQTWSRVFVGFHPNDGLAGDTSFGGAKEASASISMRALEKSGDLKVTHLLPWRRIPRRNHLRARPVSRGHAVDAGDQRGPRPAWSWAPSLGSGTRACSAGACPSDGPAWRALPSIRRRARPDDACWPRRRAFLHRRRKHSSRAKSTDRGVGVDALTAAPAQHS